MLNPSAARILVVDDDPVFLKALCATLQVEGYTVVAADGGQAGIDAFRSAQNSPEPFAVVITDLGMHPVDGRQVGAFVKNASPSTIVILLTGWGEWFENKGGMPFPADCFLCKPPKLLELRSLLRNYLGPSS
jgi:DNA-binding response OmpR family regulator